MKHFVSVITIEVIGNSVSKAVVNVKEMPPFERRVNSLFTLILGVKCPIHHNNSLPLPNHLQTVAYTSRSARYYIVFLLLGKCKQFLYNLIYI